MNFIDAYDITGPTATPPPRDGPEPTLNEEVTQVVGQLSRFWGGFRKQSQSVLESARKDLTQVVSQAQKELTKLTTEPAEESTNAPSEKDASTSGDSSDAHPAGDSSSGPSTEAPTETSPTRPGHTRGVSVSATAQNLFSRLQASLPADLAATVQAKLPESIKQGAGSIDLGQLRTTLASEFQRVQNITKAQAEEYAHKSEELLRDAGEFFKEAVKVVPPEGGSVAPPGVLWDGTDIWMLPEVNAAPSTGDSKGKGKERESKSSAEGLRAVATRAEALLKQLKHDPEVIKADPEADEKAAKLWKEWYAKEVEPKDGGIDSVEWQAAIKTALADSIDGGALQRNLSTLVPDVITRETFWTRYFFRVHQVESEEKRRKALLQNTAESEEDFDWESDEDDESSDKAVTPQGRASSLAESTKTLSAVKPETSLSTTTIDSRVSSEDGSYDVVSSQVSNADESTTKPEEQAESDSEDEDDEDDDDDEEEGDDDDDDSEEDEEEAEGGKQQTKTQVAKPPATAEAKATKVPQAKAGDDDDDSDWE